MEKVFPIRKDKRALIPAVTHVDGSGRLRSVSADCADAGGGDLVLLENRYGCDRIGCVCDQSASSRFSGGAAEAGWDR